MDGERSSGLGDLDRDLDCLRVAATDWASLAVGRKIQLLAACRAATGRSAARWTALAARAKGIDRSSLTGEEALTGPWALLSALNRYERTLAQIERRGAPMLEDGRVRLRGGQVVVEVFPEGLADRLLQFGMRGEVWMQPGVMRASLPGTMGTWYRSNDRLPRVALVLEAGNITSIGLLDALYKLIAEGCVCILKVHPFLETLRDVFEEALAPLTEAGYLRFACGGAEVGRYLCAHPSVDEIHITGSKVTYDAIAAANESGKPITSELGNVSPAIVVPGRWSDAALRYHAEQLATAKLHNNGFNCVALQVLVLPAQWAQREALLAELRRCFDSAEDRPAYYPGASPRPRAIVAVDAADCEQKLFTSEVFSPLLAVVELPGADVKSYLDGAVAFCNDRLSGTLAANLIVDPATASSHRDELAAALAALRYGCIGVNVWSGAAFLLPAIPWGGYAPQPAGAIGSGTGVVHNSKLFSKSQKSVLYAPFLPPIKPPWFITQRNQVKIGIALCEFEASGSFVSLARVAQLALAG